MKKRIYGQMVEIISEPTMVHPRFFGHWGERSSAPVQLRTHHTLSLYCNDDPSETVNRCPFDWHIGLDSDKCWHCDFNLRRGYVSVLPAWSIECGRFDARQMIAKGDYRDSEMLAVVADLPTLRLMENYVKEHFTSDGRKGRIQK